VATPEELIAFVRGLRQVREYTPQPVSDEIINDILEVGRWSGSSGNKQPAEVVVVRDPETKKKIGDWGAKPAATAAVAFVILSKNKPFSFDEGRLGERMMLAARAHGLGASFATLK
jgi:nitroreductase